MAAKSGIHLRLILNELQYGKMHNPEDEDKIAPVFMLMDNQSAMIQAGSFEIREASKHIQVRHYWLKKATTDGVLKFGYVKSGENVSDMHTKCFTEVKTAELRKLAGMMSIEEFDALATTSSSSRGGVENVNSGLDKEEDEAKQVLMCIAEECQHWQWYHQGCVRECVD
jgi:hypothetical protein